MWTQTPASQVAGKRPLTMSGRSRAMTTADAPTAAKTREPYHAVNVIEAVNAAQRDLSKVLDKAADLLGDTEEIARLERPNAYHRNIGATAAEMAIELLTKLEDAIKNAPGQTRRELRRRLQRTLVDIDWGEL